MADDITIEFEYADNDDEFSFDETNGDPDVVWAYRNGEKVGYIQFYVFESLDELEAEIDPGKYGWTVEGPFFQPNDGCGCVLYMADIHVLAEHRGTGVYDRLVRELEQMTCPTYACFTNERLGARFDRLHRPA